MDGRSALGRRWFGWTALFALVFWGTFAIGAAADWPDTRGLAAIGMATAALIGVRVRSWLWVFGPPAAIALILPVGLIRIWLPINGQGDRGADELFLGLVFGALQLLMQACAVAAAAGVAAGMGWEQRRRDRR